MKLRRYASGVHTGRTGVTGPLVQEDGISGTAQNRESRERKEEETGDYP